MRCEIWKLWIEPNSKKSKKKGIKMLLFSIVYFYDFELIFVFLSLTVLDNLSQVFFKRNTEALVKAAQT